MSRYFTSILFLLFSFTLYAQDDEEDTGPKPPEADSFHQFRIGLDISKLILNATAKERQAYEFEMDWYHRKELYYVLEGGWGSGIIDSPFLSYKSTNTFFRAGLSKSILTKLYPNDWDWAFIGMRYGIAFINRGAATYKITDTLFGNSMGTMPGVQLTAHWLELTGGVKLELFKGCFAGWNIRGRFMLNGKKFKELPPSYIAGYGRGDKNSIFDFNFYVNYAIRWKKKKFNPIGPKEE